MILASSIGQIGHPFFITFAWILAFYYHLVPDYAFAIALLTITVMVVVFPITRKATRSMMKMQLLAPEMKAIQAKYKAKQGMTVAEKRESREHLNEEMMALYREHGVSPTGGCLPMFLQLPAFWILYDTIRGLIHTTGGHPQPLYISHATVLYHDILAAPIVDGHAKLESIGIDMAASVRSGGMSWVEKIPFVLLILAAMGLQYVQMRQLQGRNPAAAQANPQMQKMQKFFPLILGIIYIAIPAGVNVYFIVSSLFRIAQQEYMHRRDPQILDAMAKLRSRSGSKAAEAIPAKVVARGGGAKDDSTGDGKDERPALKPAPSPARRAGGARKGASSNHVKTKANGTSASGDRPRPRAQSRARNKRARRPR